MAFSLGAKSPRGPLPRAASPRRPLPATPSPRGPLPKTAYPRRPLPGTPSPRGPLPGTPSPSQRRACRTGTCGSQGSSVGTPAQGGRQGAQLEMGPPLSCRLCLRRWPRCSLASLGKLHAGGPDWPCEPSQHRWPPPPKASQLPENSRTRKPAGACLPQLLTTCTPPKGGQQPCRRRSRRHFGRPPSPALLDLRCS